MIDFNDAKPQRPTRGAPIDYAERQDDAGRWYAEQIAYWSRIRRSVERYDSREELVMAMAFGRHQWTDWEGEW